jgi:hypothetical protein
VKGDIKKKLLIEHGMYNKLTSISIFIKGIKEGGTTTVIVAS